MKNEVELFKCKNYSDVYNLLLDSKIMNEYVNNLIKNNKESIIIKPNICDLKSPDTGVVTHPLLLDSLLNFLCYKKVDLDIFCVESDASTTSVSDLMRWIGYEDILKKHNVKFINLSKSKKNIMTINGKYFKKITIPSLFNENSSLISLPKMKTCSLTTVTCTLKNQFGCLPIKFKAKYHKNISNVLIDINSVLKCDLSIVDGIIAHGGTKGPTQGFPINCECLIIGTDPVATDSLVSSIMGFNPKHIDHINKAAHNGLGSLEYNLINHGFDISSAPDFKFNNLEKRFLDLAFLIQKMTRR